jgi:hypothetical protein
MRMKKVVADAEAKMIAQESSDKIRDEDKGEDDSGDDDSGDDDKDDFSDSDDNQPANDQGSRQEEKDWDERRLRAFLLD